MSDKFKIRVLSAIVLLIFILAALFIFPIFTADITQKGVAIDHIAIPKAATESEISEFYVIDKTATNNLLGKMRYYLTVVDGEDNVKNIYVDKESYLESERNTRVLEYRYTIPDTSTYWERWQERFQVGMFFYVIGIFADVVLWISAIGYLVEENNYIKKKKTM